MIIVPFWIIYDHILQKATLFNVYKKTELILKQKRIAIPAILLILLNWAWNIQKGL